jgi:hypothetical protein
VSSVEIPADPWEIREIPAGDPTRYRGALTRCRKVFRGETRVFVTLFSLSTNLQPLGTQRPLCLRGPPQAGTYRLAPLYPRSPVAVALLLLKTRTNISIFRIKVKHLRAVIPRADRHRGRPPRGRPHGRPPRGRPPRGRPPRQIQTAKHRGGLGLGLTPVLVPLPVLGAGRRRAQDRTGPGGAMRGARRDRKRAREPRRARTGPGRGSAGARACPAGPVCLRNA